MKLVIIGAIFLLVFISGCVSQTIEGPDVLYVAPATGVTGSNVTVEVKFNDVQNVLGYQFDMSYDPTVLEFVSAERGDFLRSLGHDSFFVNPKEETPGELKHFAEAVLNGGDGIPGSGTAVVVTFYALKPGTSSLELKGVKVLGTDNTEIDMDLRAGTVTVS